MDIDPDIANWVLEYLLRQPLEDRILNGLVRTLPLPKNNPRFQKSLLLKKLESEARRNLFSESTLDLLEQLEEIEFQGGSVAVSDAMKRAYCAVAVDCTVKLLKTGYGDDDEAGSDDKSRKFKFFEAVKRVWRRRIGKMLAVVEKGGLGSEELNAWKDEIEAAVWDDRVCESVVKKSEVVNVVEAVTAYVREERERMGPSFLELVAAGVEHDEDLKKLLGVGSFDQVANKGAEEEKSVVEEEVKNEANIDRVAEKEATVDRVAEKEAPSCPDRVADKEAPSCPADLGSDVSNVGKGVEGDENLNRLLGVGSGDRVAEKEASVDRVAEKEPNSCPADRGLDDTNVGKEKHEGRIKLRDKLVGLRRFKGRASGNSRGAKVVDSQGMEAERYNLPSSAEVKKAREALESSSKELQAVVKDPLPDALRIAEAISGATKTEKCPDPVEENHVAPNRFIVDSAGVVQDSVCNVSNVPKPSLMERNTTAHTCEWDESTDESQDDQACRRSIQLPSPRPIKVSPLKKYEIQDIKRRRKFRKWSLVEEDALRAGVQKYGRGNWKVILSAHRDIFDDRTEVDLKDKWRNLTRG